MTPNFDYREEVAYWKRVAENAELKYQQALELLDRFYAKAIDQDGGSGLFERECEDYRKLKRG